MKRASCRLLAGLALASLLCAPGRIEASSGGSFDMPRTLPLGPGWASSDVGNVWLLAGSLQSAGGLASSTQAFTNVSGWLFFQSGGTASVQFAQGAQQLRSRDGWALGVSTSSAIQFFFSGPMAANTLANATTVYWVADHLGGVFSSTVAFTLTYDAGQKAASISPAAGWNWGGIYQVVMTTSALSSDFNPLTSSHTANFVAMMDFSQRNVVRALGKSSMQVDVASGALPGTGLILFVSDPMTSPDRVDPAQIQTANAKALSNLGPQAAALSVVEINAYNEQGNLLSENFSVPVGLSLPYSATNGFIDGASQARSNSLALWVLNESADLWVKVPGASVGAGQVTAPLQHFSVYGLLASEDQNTSQVYPYPIPWRPFTDNPARYGTLSAGITFANLPQAGTIKIYTVSGELVRELPLTGSPSVVWDGKNSVGSYVSSEVYLWVVQSGPNRKTGKLMVVR